VPEVPLVPDVPEVKAVEENNWFVVLSLTTTVYDPMVGAAPILAKSEPVTPKLPLTRISYAAPPVKASTD
jgi:hypothetical protein